MTEQVHKAAFEGDAETLRAAIRAATPEVSAFLWVPVPPRSLHFRIIVVVHTCVHSEVRCCRYFWCWCWCWCGGGYNEAGPSAGRPSEHSQKTQTHLKPLRMPPCTHRFEVKLMAISSLCVPESGNTLDPVVCGSHTRVWVPRLTAADRVHRRGTIRPPLPLPRHHYRHHQATAAAGR